MFVAAVSMCALALLVTVTAVASPHRFRRRRATIVALTAAIARLEVSPTDLRRRHTRVLAANVVVAGPNVFALDEYRRTRPDRRRAPRSAAAWDHAGESLA